jgi:HEPN domain-containing protein
MGGSPIAGGQNAAYRLKLAQGFLEEARQDAGLDRWRSAVDGAQLTVENAAKTGLALFGRVGCTHNPATRIRRLIGEGQLETTLSKRLERLAEPAELLGPDVHAQTDYGDETGGRTPWELFEEEDARQALAIAEEAASLADQIVRETSQ